MADLAVPMHYVHTRDTDTEGTTAVYHGILVGSGRDPIATSGKPLHPSSFIKLFQAVCPQSLGVLGQESGFDSAHHLPTLIILCMQVLLCTNLVVS